MKHLTRFTQKEKWFKENWNYEHKLRINEEKKKTYNNKKIWNQVQENLTKSRDMFLSCAKEKVEKKLIEKLHLRQRDSILQMTRFLPTLTSLETDTTTAINDATEEPIEADRS